MKAFISHSSKDKHFARQIADELGDLRCEFDEYSFEYILNSQAIRQALSRCDLFVFLLSQNSINSSFVSEELRTAFEARGAGRIKDVVIFTIDSTSYSSLPDWMREINVVQRLRTPKQISTRIDARLTEAALKDGELTEFYFGRTQEEQKLRLALARNKKESPLAVHVVGHSGVGRRTFLKKALREVAPRHYSSFVEIEIKEYDAIDELYRKLYDYMEVYNPLRAGENFEKFSKLTEEEKAEAVAKYIGEMLASEIFPIFMDDFGDVFQDNGNYQEYFPLVLGNLSEHSRPAFGVVQSRMMKSGFKALYPRTIHIQIGALSEQTVFELMCLKLKDLDIDFEPSKVKEAQKFTDGHPYNINLVTAYIAEEGIDALLLDPTEVIESKAKRGHDFLRRIDFNNDEADIVALLHEYHSCELEFVLVALGRSGANITEAVRHLEDYCCIERRDTVITIAPPIRDAIRRDTRFHRSPEWLTEVGRRVVASIAEYEQSESISISFIDAALPELLRQKKEIPFITALILPTHFLRVARDFYDRTRWQQCIHFANRALEGADRLTPDARIEVNRLLGLALSRIDPRDKGIDQVVQRLRAYGGATASRVAYFIEGFRARRQGHYDVAVKKFEEAVALGRENYHINRELAHVLCRQERFVEAEPYARATYNRSPDNPYIVDVLLEALEGKKAQGLAVDNIEIGRLDRELRELCETGGFHFHSVRRSRRLYAENKAVDAISDMNSIKMEEEPEILFRRGQMFARSSDFKSARKDLQKLQQLGDEQPEALLLADQLQAECLIAETRFAEAKQHIESRFTNVQIIERNLSSALAKAISFAPGAATDELKEWARRFRGGA